ncbi:MAG: SURF1 family protein [Actinomycetota bacterium]
MTRSRIRRTALLILAVLVAAVCVRLGFWQLARLSDRRATNARIEAGILRPVAPVDAVLAGPAQDAPYRRVTATGTYLLAGELILYGRPLRSAPGDHVLTPLLLDGGDVLLVDRGWVPFEADRTAPVRDGPPPDEPVRLEGVLLPPEEGAAFPEGVPGSTVRAIDIETIAATTGLDLAPVYLLLQAQTPPQAGDLPTPAMLAARDEGPHLSYAIQWFSFAAIAIVGYVLLMRRDRGSRHGADDGAMR